MSDLKYLCWVYIWNLNLKFKPQAVQDLSKILALESHQNNAPINFDKFFKSVVKLPFLFVPECTVFSFDISFFSILYFDLLFFFFFF